MSYNEIIFSPSGGTKRVATAIEGEHAENITSYDLTDKRVKIKDIAFTADDICYIAVPSFGGRVPEIAAKKIKIIKGNGARAVLICAYGNRAYDDTMLELMDVAKEAGFVCVAGVCGVTEHSIARQFATGRPDAADMDVLEKFAEKVEKKLESGDRSEPAVPGKRPYRVYNGSAIKPVAGPDICIGCGLCSEQCPVGAINMFDIAVTNKERCISCMKCVAVCPMGARVLPKDMVNAFATKAAPLFAERKEPELFI